jgi:hypothetical protein
MLKGMQLGKKAQQISTELVAVAASAVWLYACCGSLIRRMEGVEAPEAEDTRVLGAWRGATDV